MPDTLDERLLGLLKVNGRESVASLARNLDVSRTTIQDRIRRLENNGVIAGYSVRLGSDQTASRIEAFVEVSLEPQRLPAILYELKSIAAIETVHTVSGKFDLVIMLYETTPARIDKVLDKIGEIKGITKTSSAIILSTKLDRR